MKKQEKFFLLSALFITFLTLLNILSVKITHLWGLAFTAGTYLYAITFPITDTIAEVWGKKKAHNLIWMGFLSNIVVVATIYIFIALPSASFWEGQEAFAQTLGIVGRIALASMTAYLIAQHHDIWAFHWWKNKTQGKHLWLRNNLSTVVSQLLDACIFSIIAFYGIMPNDALLKIIIGTWIVKISIAIIDTPVVYGLVRWCKK